MIFLIREKKGGKDSERENIFLRRKRKTQKEKEKNIHLYESILSKEKKTGEGKYFFAEEKEMEEKYLETEQIFLAEEWKTKRRKTRPSAVRDS